MKKNRKKFFNKDLGISQRYTGFTLAEVLITLVIIGVVAAFTIPTLMNKTNDLELKTAWKKDYSTISQAYEMAKNNNGGDVAEYFTGTIDSLTVAPFIKLMESHLAITQSCSTVASINLMCDASSGVTLDTAYKTAAGTFLPQYDFFYHQSKLSNGANIYYRLYSQNYSLIFVDVNGYAKKPNVLGRDLFGAVITKDRMIPMGAKNSGTENTCVSTVIGADGTVPPNTYHGLPIDISGAGCSAEYLYK